MPARTLGPEGGWNVRSHIDWREELVPARTLKLKGGGVDCEILHRLERGNSVSEDAGLEGRWCEIPRRLERETKHSL